MAAGNQTTPEAEWVPRKALMRERRRRVMAEHLLEERARELYASNLEIKANQQHLIQAEKLATVGMLFAGIAHEINNPVAFVTANANTVGGYLAVLLQGYEQLVATMAALAERPELANSDALAELRATFVAWQDEQDPAYIASDCDELVTEMLEGLERITRIVGELRSYSRSDSEQQVIDLSEALSTACRFARPKAPPGAELTVDYGATQTVIGVESRLSQVFLNLIVNAYQASEAVPEPVTVRSFDDGNFVCVEVVDRGCGISDEGLAKLFEPFYTTKPSGVGTGLGLSVSDKIVRDHGGTIAVTSTLGAGTTMIVRLPAAERTPDQVH